MRSSRKSIRDILNHQDSRLLIIAGPCSIHNTTAALEYARKFKALAEEVSDTFFLVMRAYFEKPRTGTGWRGLLHDPNINGQYDIETGLKIAREFFLQLTELEVPIASEILDPSIGAYLGDMITWGSIGARTPESQIHRQVASGLDFPIGIKNSTSGDLLGAINGIRSASQANSYIGINGEGKVSSILTKGNQDTHLVLRGSHNQPNYDAQSLRKAAHLLEECQLPPRVIVDCSHGNSMKDPEKQPEVFANVMEQFHSGNRAIRGLMLESHIHEGNQTKPLRYGVSITDACISWETTEHILLKYVNTSPAGEEAYACKD